MESDTKTVVTARDGELPGGATRSMLGDAREMWRGARARPGLAGLLGAMKTTEPAGAAAEAGYRVRVEGAGGGEYAVTPEGLVVGRPSDSTDPPDVPLRPDGTASRRHARIFADDGACWVEDMGSKNGTFVHGERVDGRRRLAIGDRVTIGDQDLLILERAAEAKRESEPAGNGDTRTTPAPRGDAPPTPVPGADAPAKPGADAPARPGADAPTRPGADAPAKPKVSRRRSAKPAPAADTPVPSSDAPAKPAGADTGPKPRNRRGTGLTRLQSMTEAEALVDVPAPDPVAYTGAPLKIGRDKTNDLVLDDPNVSRFHAVIEPGPARPSLRDLDSRNGTRVDGAQLSSAPLNPGTEIGIGPFRLIFTGTEVRARNERGDVSIEAVGVSVKARGRQLLAPTYLKIHPGELVAIIGENGAGKTTLLKALAGVSTPSAGVTLINGEPVSQRLTDVGYVPQDDTVHPWLTVEEALRFGAELRLPDRTPAEITEAVDTVIEQLQLTDKRGNLIGKEGETSGNRLSGGERKRVCVAMEMLSRPSVVFLDEPLAPVDPWFSKELLQVFRTLAENSCSVVMVTHRPEDLGRCDKVAVLARGGYLCYYGPPAGALEFFGVQTYEDIYRALRNQSGEQWANNPGGDVLAARLTASVPKQVAVAPPKRRLKPAELWPQTKVLARRYALLMRRDRVNLMILAACVAVIAVALLAFKSDVFTGDETKAPTFLFILAYAMVVLGLVVSFRELVKERAVYKRERAVGVEPRAYLASKLIVLSAVGALAATTLTVLAFILHPLHQSVVDYAGSLIILLLTTLAGIGLGLTISVLVRREDQATTMLLIPIVLLLLFGGSVLPLSGGVKIPAALMPDRWSFAALGRLAHLPGLPVGQTSQYQATFSTGTPLAILILCAFPVVLAAFVAWRLESTSD